MGSSTAADEQDDDTAVWMLFRTWASGLSWSSPTAGTNDDVMYIDADHMIPAMAMQTSFVTAMMPYEEYSAIFTGSSRTNLDIEAQKAGWKQHSLFDADGPTGTIWGYRKDTPDGVRFLTVSANGTDCTTSGDAPIECSEYTAKVSLTSALPADADL